MSIKTCTKKESFTVQAVIKLEADQCQVWAVQPKDKKSEI